MDTVRATAPSCSASLETSGRGTVNALIRCCPSSLKASCLLCITPCLGDTHTGELKVLLTEKAIWKQGSAFKLRSTAGSLPLQTASQSIGMGRQVCSPAGGRCQQQPLAEKVQGVQGDADDVLILPWCVILREAGWRQCRSLAAFDARPAEIQPHA